MEKRAAERSGIDPKAMKEELTQFWRSTDFGTAFKAAIEERGYVLAKGDRRDFCVVDRAGDAHSLARRLDGVKTAEVRTRMSDVDREALPSVEEAREQQRATPPREQDTPQSIYDQSEVRRQSQLEREQMRRDRAAGEPAKDYNQAKAETFEPRQESKPGFGNDPSPVNSAEAGLEAGLGVANSITGGVEKARGLRG